MTNTRTTTDLLAAEYRGTPARCQHQTRGYCTRCPAPTFCVCWKDAAYQFGDADDAVGFMRRNAKRVAR